MADAPAAPASPAALVRGQETILLVEDEEEVRAGVRVDELIAPLAFVVVGGELSVLVL